MIRNPYTAPGVKWTGRLARHPEAASAAALALLALSLSAVTP